MEQRYPVEKEHGKSSKGKKLPRVLSKDEVNAMLQAVTDNTRDYTMIMILFYAGLRSNEAKTLHKDDIDFINNNIFVREGKGNKQRIVPLPRILREHLESYVHWGSSPYVFTGRGINPLTNRLIRLIVKKAAKRAGIRKPDEVHPHTLRHSYATYLGNKGVDLGVIQRLLGHSDITTTVIYTHLATEKLEKDVKDAFE